MTNKQIKIELEGEKALAYVEGMNALLSWTDYYRLFKDEGYSLEECYEAFKKYEFR